MASFVKLYRRLDLIQRKRSFRIAASVVALLLCASFFGPLLAKTYDLHSQRLRLGQALAGQNFDDGDAHAVSLRETGTVTLDGRTYGGPALARQASPPPMISLSSDMRLRSSRLFTTRVAY